MEAKKQQTPERPVFPGMLKIKFISYPKKLRITITIKETYAHMSMDVENSSAVWIPRNQCFKGEGAEQLNARINETIQYFIDVYRSRWSLGEVTAHMLKASFDQDFNQVSKLSKYETLLSKKDNILAEISNAWKNKPMRSKSKISKLEEKLQEINSKISSANKRDLLSPEIKPRKKRVAELTGAATRFTRNRIKIRFQIRKQRMNALGMCAIECKVSVNGIVATRFSTGVQSSVAKWDSKFQAIIGDEASTSKLTSIREGLEGVYQEFRKKGLIPEPEEIIAHYFDHELEFDKRWTVEDLAEAQLKDLFRRKRTKPTLMKYQRVFTLFQEIMQIKLVEDVKIAHIRQFHEHLKTKGYSQDYTNKCVLALHGLFELAVTYEAITINPVKGLRLEWERKVNLTCLNEEELEALKSTNWSNKLQGVVDSFLFMCYTGLHITDYLNLKNINVKSYRGDKFIEYSRQKNDQVAMVPLGKEASELIERYGSVEALPRISAQKQNDYLKVVAAHIKTDKLLTNKVARKTFTDMSINERQMSFEAVAGMLGHASTNFVKVYGRVRHNRIFSEWNR